MPLDRQSIEKRDFPIGRRGYEPEAVDAHLAALASQVETLQRGAQRQGGDSLASAASAQVQSIVEAAESSAAEIEQDARDEAARIRDEASRDAQRTRDHALERSQEHVGQVQQSSALMLQRVDAMESELGALVESLRTGANRLTADLSLLEANMGELYSAAGSDVQPPDSVEDPGLSAPVVAADLGQAGVEPEAPQAPLSHADAAVSEPDLYEDELYEEPAPAAAPAPQGGREATPDATEPLPPAVEQDVEGARLVALNMALNGQARDETDRYLADNFDLGDRQGLLDEVYATVGG